MQWLELVTLTLLFPGTYLHFSAIIYGVLVIGFLKARIEQLNRYYYPDVMVTCDERDQENITEKKFPCLIVEVLSDSTEAFDRGDENEHTL